MKGTHKARLPKVSTIHFRYSSTSELMETNSLYYSMKEREVREVRDGQDEREVERRG